MVLRTRSPRTTTGYYLITLITRGTLTEWLLCAFFCGGVIFACLRALITACEYAFYIAYLSGHVRWGLQCVCVCVKTGRE